MLVIENCNSLSELRQKLIDGEEVRTARYEPCDDMVSRDMALEKMADYVASGYADSVKDFEEYSRIICQLPPVNPQPKTGHWVYKIYGGFHEQGDWYCSHCDYQFNYGNGHAEYCPKCGCKMSETPTEEVIRDRDYDWVTRR